MCRAVSRVTVCQTTAESLPSQQGHLPTPKSLRNSQVLSTSDPNVRRCVSRGEFYEEEVSLLAMLHGDPAQSQECPGDPNFSPYFP
jgi:hypothetical protein